MKEAYLLFSIIGLYIIFKLLEYTKLLMLIIHEAIILL